jgi:GNAT superfamily N-acetyltransferase
MGVALEPVAPDAVPRLHAMLLALAESDGVSDVRTTPASLHAALFATPPAAVAHFIRRDADVAGFTLHTWKWGTFTGVQDLCVSALYVSPAHRRAGVGRAAMAALARLATERGCARMEWLAVAAKHDTAAFYDAIGSAAAGHMAVRRLQGTALRALAATADREQA